MVSSEVADAVRVRGAGADTDGSEEHPQPGHQADLAAAGPGRVQATLRPQGAADCIEQGLAAARRGRQQEAPGDICDGPGQGLLFFVN